MSKLLALQFGSRLWTVGLIITLAVQPMGDLKRTAEALPVQLQVGHPHKLIIRVPGEVRNTVADLVIG